MAFLVTIGGIRSPLIPKNSTDFKLEELQKLVGGNIELFSIDPPLEGKYPEGICNEDGLGLGLPYNQRASSMAHLDLVGPVVFLEKGEMR